MTDFPQDLYDFCQAANDFLDHYGRNRWKQLLTILKESLGLFAGAAQGHPADAAIGAANPLYTLEEAVRIRNEAKALHKKYGAQFTQWIQTLNAETDLNCGDWSHISWLPFRR